MRWIRAPPVDRPVGASSHSSTARCFSRSRWFALYSSAGERIRSRISRTAAAAVASDSDILACANTSVFPPVRFSPSDPDSSQAISRKGPSASSVLTIPAHCTAAYLVPLTQDRGAPVR
ncbi:hypothetical protein SVIOM74S_00779 [Streptomyces violarus]